MQVTVSYQELAPAVEKAEKILKIFDKHVTYKKDREWILTKLGYYEYLVCTHDGIFYYPVSGTYVAYSEVPELHLKNSASRFLSNITSFDGRDVILTESEYRDFKLISNIDLSIYQDVEMQSFDDLVKEANEYFKDKFSDEVAEDKEEPDTLTEEEAFSIKRLGVIAGLILGVILAIVIWNY